jgi:thiamine biosynthesis lipoprotein
VTEHDHRFRIFGTDVRVLVASPLDALRVQALFRRLHRTLTRFDPSSELSALNAATGQAVAVSATLWRAVSAAVWAARASDGLVDPTVLTALERAGYASSRDGATTASLAEALRGAPVRRSAGPSPSRIWEAIEFDPARRTIRLPAPARIDLGGTAKGLAADLAAQALAHHDSYTVDVGGDIRIGGSRPGPRDVRIEHPLHDEIAHRFTVFAGAVATSGLRTRVWPTENGFAHHLIDPARGTPAWTGVIQATGLAPTTLEAEMLAKTALLRGPRHGRDLLAHHGGALVLDDGELILIGDLALAPAGANA